MIQRRQLLFVCLVLSRGSEALTGTAKSRPGKTTRVMRMTSNYDMDPPAFEDKPRTTERLAGDYGFDPLEFSKDRPTFMRYREMEIKHARLAMLAAGVGVPATVEMIGRPFVESTGGDVSIFQAALSTSTSPVYENLDHVPPQVWGFLLGLTAVLDTNQQRRESSSSYVPGDLGWNLFPGIPPNEKQSWQEGELQAGRLAMLGVTTTAAGMFALPPEFVEELPNLEGLEGLEGLTYLE